MLNIQNFIDDAKCFEKVRELRWGDGILCPQAAPIDVLLEASRVPPSFQKSGHCRSNLCRNQADRFVRPADEPPRGRTRNHP